jgi:hypothetical protein
LQQAGSWCALKGCVLWQKKLSKLKDDPLLGVKQQCILRTAETTFRTCSKVLNHKVTQHSLININLLYVVKVNSINSMSKLLNPDKMFISDRMRKLLEILKNYSPTRREKAGIKDPLSGLIFVNERFIAFMINVIMFFFI